MDGFVRRFFALIFTTYVGDGFMRGLALEGGGARGAYHIGVVKALYDAGYEFDGFVGTSIGAINAAILASGDFDKAMEVWAKISIEQLFDEEDQSILQLVDRNALKKNPNLLSAGGRKAIEKILGYKGINTKKMKLFLRQYINEDKIRKSGKDFGLATISLSKRKAQELMKEDIPDGQLFDFIMASAAHPFFSETTIDESVYLDGFFHNNCPYNLLIDKGYEEVIIVRTKAFGVFRKTDNPKVKMISPNDNLGSTLLFSPENSTTQLTLGYYDGLRYTQNLLGKEYYIKSSSESNFNTRLLTLDDELIMKVGEMLKLPDMPAKRMLFERIIPTLGDYLKLDKNFTYADFIIALLEHEAKGKRVERFHVYDYDKFCFMIANAPEAIKETNVFSELFSGQKEKAIKMLHGCFTVLN